MRGLTFPGLGSGCWALSFEKPTDKINTPCLVLDLTAPARHLQAITCSQMAQTFIERLLCFEGLPIQWGRLTAGGEDTARGTSHPRGDGHAESQPAAATQSASMAGPPCRSDWL